MGVFVALQALLILVTSWSTHAWGVHAAGDPRLEFPGRWLLGGLVRFDGGWYSAIAMDGYSIVPGAQSNVAYFPLYPLTMRAVGVVVGSAPLSGIVISSVAGCVATVLLARWARLRGLSAAATTATVAAFLLYPYAWYLYGVVYSDALFVALALAAAIAVERDRVVLAAALLALVTADRPTGVAIAVGLVARHLERHEVFVHDTSRGPAFVRRWCVPNRLQPSRLAMRDLVLVGGFAGIVAYVVFLASRFGDPLAFLHAQRYWGQAGGPTTIFKTQYFWELTHFVHRSLVVTLTAQAVLLVVAVLLVPVVGRRFGWGYGVMQAALVAMPLWGSKDFQGSGRYLLVLFPAFALGGEHLARRPPLVRRVVLGVSGLGMLVLAAGFAHGVYLA